MSFSVEHQETGDRGVFHLQQGGRRVGEMTYSRTNPALVVVDHTYVDPALRGQGAARHLQEAMVAWARETGTKVVPLCSYVKAQFDRDRTMRDVQA